MTHERTEIYIFLKDHTLEKLVTGHFSENNVPVTIHTLDEKDSIKKKITRIKNDIQNLYYYHVKGYGIGGGADGLQIAATALITFVVSDVVAQGLGNDLYSYLKERVLNVLPELKKNTTKSYNTFSIEIPVKSKKITNVRVSMPLDVEEARDALDKLPEVINTLEKVSEHVYTQNIYLEYGAYTKKWHITEGDKPAAISSSFAGHILNKLILVLKSIKKNDKCFYE